MARIFISYTTPDKTHALRVDRVLTEAGHETVAMHQFAGRWTRRMAEAIADCDRLALIATPAARKSPGVTLEIEEFLAKDLAAEDIIPLVFEPCGTFPLLRSLVMHDLHDLEEAEGDARIVSLMGGPIDPVPNDVAAPDWPEIISTGMRLTRPVQGRQDDVTKLFGLLEDQSRTAIVPGAAIKGAGGMGKTTLARYYIDQYKHLYRGIWWIRAQTQDSIIEDLGELSGDLGVPAADHPTPKALAGAVVRALEKQADPWLLIYDNAERAEDLADWVPQGPRILITSREGVWKDYPTLAAERLDSDPATDLLMQEAERTEDRDGAAALADALGHLPLALVNAGAWLRDTPGTSFADYEARIEELIRDKPETVTDYPDSVFAAVSLSLDKLGADAALVMNVFAHLSPDDLWPGLVTDVPKSSLPNPQEFWDDIPEDLMDLARDSARVERAFAELERRSLLERGEAEGAWRIHRLTQAVQRAVAADQRKAVPGEDPGPPAPGTGGPGSSPGQLEDGGADWRAIAAAMLASGTPYNPTLRENWPTFARLGPHLSALADLDDPPTTAAMEYLLNQASVYLHTQRLDDRALAYSEKNLALTEARLGPEHETVGIVCNNLAGQYYRLGRHEEAEAMAARTIEIEEGNPKVSEESFAISLSTHGIMAQMVGSSLTGQARREKLSLAARRYQKALLIHRQNLFGVRLYTPWLNNLANLRAFQGRWGAALRLHGAALRLRRAALPPDDPSLAQTLSNLGSTLLQSGRARGGYRGHGALDLLTEALAVFEDAYPDRPEIEYRVTTAQSLAVAHWCLADLGGDITGDLAPDPARADALCAAYNQDADKLKADAAFYADRARLYESGQPVPPLPGQGED